MAKAKKEVMGLVKNASWRNIYKFWGLEKKSKFYENAFKIKVKK